MPEKVLEADKSMNVQIKDDAMIGGDVNINIEAPKSEATIWRESLNRYRAKCREVLEDNIIEPRERAILDALAAELHISKEDAQKIEDGEADINRRQKSQLDKISLVVLKQLIKKFRSGDFDGVAKLFVKLEGMNRKYDDEEIRFYYYLLLSVFNPNGGIRQYESRKEDCYWQSYWVVMSYLKTGRKLDAETAKNTLGNWTEREEENILLLEIAIAILNKDFDMADAFREVIEASYAPALQDFAEALFIVLFSKDNYKDLSPEPQTLFYVDGMFASITNRTGIGVLMPDGKLSYQQSTPQNTNIDSNTNKEQNNGIANSLNVGYYLIEGNEAVGPLNAIQLYARYLNGKISMKSLVWRDGMQNWQKIIDLSELKFIFDKPSMYETRGNIPPIPSECLFKMAMKQIETKPLTKDDIDHGNYRFSESIGNLVLIRDCTKHSYFAWLQEKEEMVVISEFTNYGKISDDYYWVKSTNNQYLILDSKNLLISTDTFDSVKNYGKFVIVSNNDDYSVKYGLIDLETGTYALDIKYSMIRDYFQIRTGGFLKVQSETGEALYNCKLKEFATNFYDEICPRTECLIELGSNYMTTDLYSFIHNHVWKECRSETYLPNSNIMRLYKISNRGMTAFCNVKDCNAYTDFFDCMLYAYVDKDEILEKYPDFPIYHCFVCKDDKWGILDVETCKMVLPAVYEDANPDLSSDEKRVILTKNGQNFTYNMVTRKFE